ncbi:MAG: cardiolipin synthase B [Acidobacteria bacterium]|nr:cardiolipin synthase B [Acidobacteriota bacterium]
MEGPSVLLVLALAAAAVQGFLLFLALFGPTHRYKITRSPKIQLDSPEFVQAIEILADARVYKGNRVEVLDDGPVFYEAELEAIRQARRSVNLEAYIFQKGEVTRRFLAALTERARAGVKVNLVLDSVGSFASWNSYFRDLRAAGGRLAWYHDFRWHSWPRYNNRTHRELIVIDGSIGFIGGAGFADNWLKGRRQRPRWRDTMFGVEGPAVAGMQATFAENWLEASGEILFGKEYFPLCEPRGETAAMIVNSSPSAGASTRARMLFQTLLASAQREILITTPYFLPDSSARAEMVRAVRERGVDLRVIAPGRHNDHLLTRRSSRRLYGELLRGGVRIYEYRPSMIHTKSMVVDGLWSVVGSTNFDHRSFGLNDEVNLAADDAALAGRLKEDFERDLARCREITLRQWIRRSLWERLHEWLGWTLERQQ